MRDKRRGGLEVHLSPGASRVRPPTLLFIYLPETLPLTDCVGLPPATLLNKKQTAINFIGKVAGLAQRCPGSVGVEGPRTLAASWAWNIWPATFLIKA